MHKWWLALGADQNGLFSGPKGGDSFQTSLNAFEIQHSVRDDPFFFADQTGSVVLGFYDAMKIPSLLPRMGFRFWIVLWRPPEHPEM